MCYKTSKIPIFVVCLYIVLEKLIVVKINLWENFNVFILLSDLKTCLNVNKVNVLKFIFAAFILYCFFKLYLT
jgi:hypothetical protein